jgi:hypothetical protein
MVQEKKLFVSTNFRSISGLGFQFFDRIVTMQNTAQLNRQNNEKKICNHCAIGFWHCLYEL